MATYYVDPVNGNDTTGNGSQEAPWATIHKAFSSLTAGTHEVLIVGNGAIVNEGTNQITLTTDGVNVTVRPENTGNHFTVHWDSEMSDNRGIYVSANGSSITFQKMILDQTTYPVDAWYTFFLGINWTNGSLTFKDCDLDANTAAFMDLQNNTGTTSGSLTITRCRIRASTPTTAAMLRLYDIGNVTFTNCSFEGADELTSRSVVQIRVKGDNIIFTGCTVDTPHYYLLSLINMTDYLEFITVEKCKLRVDSLMRIAEYLRRVVIQHNTIENTGEQGPLFGIETDGITLTVNNHPFEEILIYRNLFQYTNSNANHLLSIFIGAEDAQIVGNSFISDVGGTSFGIVLKADRIHFRGNYIRGPQNKLVYVSGAAAAFIYNNVIVMMSTNQALAVSVNQDYDVDPNYGLPTDAKLFDNMVLCPNGGVPLAVEYDHLGDDGILVDQNQYETSGTTLATLGTTTVLTSSGIKGLQDAWFTFVGGLGNKGAANDMNSRLVTEILEHRRACPVLRY